VRVRRGAVAAGVDTGVVAGRAELHLLTGRSTRNQEAVASASVTATRAVSNGSPVSPVRSPSTARNVGQCHR
jgi:hypothetical protein